MIDLYRRKFLGDHNILVFIIYFIIYWIPMNLHFQIFSRQIKSIFLLGKKITCKRHYILEGNTSHLQKSEKYIFWIRLSIYANGRITYQSDLTVNKGDNTFSKAALNYDYSHSFDGGFSSNNLPFYLIISWNKSRV